MVVSGSFSPPRLSHGAADSGTTFSSKKTNSTTGNKGALLMIGTSLGRVRFLGRIISAAVEGLHGFQGLVTYSLLARPDKNLKLDEPRIALMTRTNGLSASSAPSAARPISIFL